MSTYYEYRDVKVKIAHRLFQMDGWKVYGYSPDNSDLMTDYYDPAYWNGIATKNGFILVVDRSDERTEDAYITKRTTTAAKIDRETADKIAKLERMTQANGASEQEEQTARAAIEKLKNKGNSAEGTAEECVLTEPAHKANPPRCNWHIEKNGIIIAKGNGLLKFSNVIDLSYDREKEDYTYFKTATREGWENKEAQRLITRFNDSPERAAEAAARAYKTACADYALLDKFTQLLTSWSNLCGGQVGNAGEDGFVYEEVEVTEYKTELQPRETATGEIKDGQMFVLKSNFNYCRHKGTVFVIRSSEYTDSTGKVHITYRSNALGKGYKREKTGSAYENHFSLYDIAKFEAWITKGAIAWVELEEVKTPYQVKKVVKKPLGNTEKSAKTTTKATADTTTTGNTKAATTGESDLYTIAQDTHTKTGETIFTVKVNPDLTPDEWKAEREKMKAAGGYYSKFKHAFIFKTEEEARAAAGIDTEESTQENTADNTNASGNTTENIQPEFTIGGKAIGKLHAEKVINGRVLYIIDAAELPDGRYEVIVMNPDHIDIAITTTADKNEARRAFWEYCKLYEVQPDGIEPPTDEEPTDETPTDDTEPATSRPADTDSVTVGMQFMDETGKLFTITNIDDMHIEINGGEQAMYDFGTRRTVADVKDSISFGNPDRITAITPQDIADTPTADETAPEEPTTSGEDIIGEEPTAPNDETTAGDHTSGEGETDTAKEEPTAPQNELTSDRFTPEEIEILTHGGQVANKYRWYTSIITATRYNDKTYLVYSIMEKNGKPEPGRAADYIGFITDGAFYENTNKIKTALTEAINTAVIQRIPSQATAEKNAATAPKWEQENAAYYKDYSGVEQARRAFFEEEPPVLTLFHGSDRLEVENLISYIEDPTGTTDQIATTYIKEHSGDILGTYYRYTSTLTEYLKITENPNAPEHLIKAIRKSIGENIKTVNIILIDGTRAKCNAHALASMYYNLNTWYIAAADRDKLPDRDITPDMIQSITHGKRTLYEKPAA